MIWTSNLARSPDGKSARLEVDAAGAWIVFFIFSIESTDSDQRSPFIVLIARNTSGAWIQLRFAVHDEPVMMMAMT